MEVIIQKIIEDIQHFSIAELRTLCTELKRENVKLNSALLAYKESDTDLARDYQTAQRAISDLLQQLKELRNSYNHIAAQNELLNRHRLPHKNTSEDYQYKNQSNPNCTDFVPDALILIFRIFKWLIMIESLV